MTGFTTYLHKDSSLLSEIIDIHILSLNDKAIKYFVEDSVGIYLGKLTIK
jgi:hypothetical protein